MSDPTQPGGWPAEEALRLHGAHRLALVRLAVLLVDDLPTAQDVVQDAFAGFLGRSTSLRDPDEALAWLRGEVVRAARGVRRTRRRAERGAPEPGPGRDRATPADRADAAPDELQGDGAGGAHEGAGTLEAGPADAPVPERITAVDAGPDPAAVLAGARSGELSPAQQAALAAVRALPDRQREVLVLRAWASLTDAEVSDALGTGRRAVLTAEQEAPAALAALLAESGEEPSSPEQALDRATRALAARAEQVGLDDLRPAGLPEPRRPRRHRLLLTAAVVAVAGLVAVPFLGDPPESAEPEPPLEPAIPRGAVELDLDGDGRDDLATVSYDAAARTYLVRVELADGSTLRQLGLTQSQPTLLGALDLDDDFAEELALQVDRGPGALPDVLRLVRGNLRRLRPPPTAREVEGWDPSSELNRFSIRRGDLYTWRFDPARDPAELQRTGLWRWTVEDEDRLVPRPPQQRCITAADDFPGECVSLIPEDRADVIEADLDGDGRDDRVTLSYEARTGQRSVRGFELEVRYADGDWTVRREGPGGRPALWRPVTLGEPGREQVLVERFGGDVRPLLVYGVVGGADGGLTRLDPPEGYFLGSGGIDSGRPTVVEVEEGRLITYRVMEPRSRSDPPSFARAEAYEWVIRDDRLLPVLMFGQCVDPSTGAFPEVC